LPSIKESNFYWELNKLSKLAKALIVTLAIAVLSINESSANFSTDDFVQCRNVSTDPLIPAAGVCGPDVNPILEFGVPRFTWITGPEVPPVADMFDVSFLPSCVILTFTADAAGRLDTADENVFLLGDINPVPDALINIETVDFIGTWSSRPSEDPTFNNTGLPSNQAQIRWDLAGAIPSAGDSAVICLDFQNPSLIFVPNAIPTLGALTTIALALLLAALGAVGIRGLKSRRE
jgi:hypothetical protein